MKYFGCTSRHSFGLLALLFALVSYTDSLARDAQEIVFQPGPADGQDVWITSVYSYDDDYGVNDEKLRVGGWADYYYTLIQFDMSSLPHDAASAVLYVYTFGNDGGSNVSMYLDRIMSFWDESTGWYTKPSTYNLRTIAAPSLGTWYAIDITDLYNEWQSGDYPNYGIQLRPTGTAHQFNEFYSSDHIVAELRPKLVIRTTACPDGSLFSQCRMAAGSDILFAPRYTADAASLTSQEPGEAVYFDETWITVTKEAGDRFFLSGSPYALAPWVCDDRLYIGWYENGSLVQQYIEPVGFSGIRDATFPLCRPIEDILSYVEAREITAFVPDGANCIWFGLADTQRQIYGNTAIYLVSDPAVPTENISWGQVKALYE